MFLTASLASLYRKFRRRGESVEKVIFSGNEISCFSLAAITRLLVARQLSVIKVHYSPAPLSPRPKDNLSKWLTWQTSKGKFRSSAPAGLASLAQPSISGNTLSPRTRRFLRDTLQFIITRQKERERTRCHLPSRRLLSRSSACRIH